LAHVVIIVLPSMQDLFLDMDGGMGVVKADIVTNYRCFHKLWASSYDGNDPHFNRLNNLGYNER
jgi:hypothetical protein